MNYLESTIKILNNISPSFCAAKWYSVSLWLGNGRTASCHHPMAHTIPLDELKLSDSALHNTSYKKEQRKLMLEGKRPEECGYCWRVEDLQNPDVYSDRVYKSVPYTDQDIQWLQEQPFDSNIIPKKLEVCFDNLCNLSCSYCNSEFSSKWFSDIETNGPYTNLHTPGGLTYTHNSARIMPYGQKNENNPYLLSFFKWFADIKNNLQEFRVSGGEPTRSPWFWQLVEQLKDEKFIFSVNSNLMMTSDRLDKLINLSGQFPKMSIFTSCESIGKNAEFVRAGLIYDEWKTNLYKLQIRAPDISTTIMMTVSALSIWTMPEFIDDLMCLRLRTQSEVKTPISCYRLSINILRFPSFQSVNILDDISKKKVADRLVTVLNKHRRILDISEVNNIQRCIEYINNVDKGYEDSDSLVSKLADFKQFVNQYSTRKNMSAQEYMPLEFLDFYNSI